MSNVCRVPRRSRSLLRVAGREIDAVAGRAPLPSDDLASLTEVTQQLLGRLLAEAGIEADDIVSVIAAAPDGTRSGFPATAARSLGLHHVPLLGVAGPARGDEAGDVQLLIHHRRR